MLNIFGRKLGFSFCVLGTVLIFSLHDESPPLPLRIWSVRYFFGIVFLILILRFNGLCHGIEHGFLADFFRFICFAVYRVWFCHFFASPFQIQNELQIGPNKVFNLPYFLYFTIFTSKILIRSKRHKA